MKNLLSLPGTVTKKRNFILVVGLLLMFVAIIFVKNDSTNKQTTILSTPEPTLSPQEIKEADRKQWIKAFISDLQRFPKFKSEIKIEDIQKVFPLNLGNRPSGWLAEVKRGVQSISYYLLTPVLEKELIDPKSCVSEDKDPPIELEKAEAIGALAGSYEKPKYLVLSGTKNNCYGGAGSGFVSAYDLQTGEKIKFQGDFTVFGTGKKSVSETGNALGRLRGTYGRNHPTVVVEYGSHEYAGSTLEEVSSVAYFDLQTGKLKQLIKFD